MVEKQASSEIAQSRERFEKWARAEFDDSLPFDWDEKYGEYSMAHPTVEAMWRTFLAAERDTRERVAKLARDIAKEVGGNFAETHRLNVGLNKFIKELERIRGKE